MTPRTICSSRSSPSPSSSTATTATLDGCRRRRAAALDRHRRAALPPTPSSDGGFRLLERANALVPQGLVVGTARAGWRLAWQAMVRELAPQQKGAGGAGGGAYMRPGHAFSGGIDASAAAALLVAASSGGGRGLKPPAPYALYVGNACPWCHCVLLALALRGMWRRDGGQGGGGSGGATLVRVVELLDDPERATRGGWVITGTGAGAGTAKDPVFGARDLYGVYEAASPGFRGRCTAPLLVDAARRRPVCNESAELVRSLLKLRPAASGVVNRADLLPAQHRAEVERLNALIYERLANGVYRAGFSTSQRAFDEALLGVQACLSELELRLSERRFLCGEHLTEADVRLFPALSRLDAAYHGFFLRGAPLLPGGGAPVGGLAALFPNLHGWLNDVWELPGVQGTIDVAGARESYWRNLFPLNPGGIVPPGPGEAAVRAALDGAGGAEVAARRRRRFGAPEVVTSVEEVCALF